MCWNHNISIGGSRGGGGLGVRTHLLIFIIYVTNFKSTPPFSYFPSFALIIKINHIYLVKGTVGKQA